MIEWWTYTLGDFLMFAPRTYWRLVELHNAAWWPAPVILPLAGAVAVLALWRRAAAPAVCVLLALVWGWLGWAFHAQRYAAINWAAEGFSVAFFAEALLWFAAAALVAWRTTPLSTEAASTMPRRVGLLLWLVALVGSPLLAPLVGRPWAQAEVFGVMPDPTVLATLGSLLLWRDGRLPCAWCVGLAIVPLAWCMISGATLLAMNERIWPVLPAAGTLWVAVAWAGWRSRRREA